MFLLIIYAAIIFTTLADPVVETKYGKIQGFSLKLEKDVLANIFMRVPFAAAPVGNLRLEKPLPPEPWTNTYNATYFGPSCIQLIRMGSTTMESEDCLHLNIIAPQEKSPNGNPVLFWIHSGGYELGSANQYGYNGIAERWAPRGIIVVTINYRLGALGWLSNGDKVLPGNIGFWDMTAALKFVRENIQAFGGDPNKITVWGASSGGAAVSALSLSPYSRDLFQQVFQMSGSPFAEWAASEYVVEESIKVVKELNCFDSDVNKIKLCMKKISIDELQSAYEKLGTTRPGLSPILYTPRIDDDFLPKTFEELIKEAPRKAILSGFASQEGAKLTVWPRQLVRGQIIPREEQFTYDGNRLFEFIKNYISPEEYFGSEATAKKVQTMVEEFYANDIPQNADYKFWLQKYSQLISDTSINMPQLEEAKLRAEHDWPVYFYQTAYFNYDAIKETFKGDHPVKGAWHLSEYPYLFGFSSLDQFEFNENDWTIQKFWLELVENFVKNGNPSLPGLTWPRISKEKFQFVNVTIEPVVENDLMSDMLTFWKELIENYRLDVTNRQKHKNHRKMKDEF